MEDAKLLISNAVLYALPGLFLLMALWLSINPVSLWKHRKVPGPMGWPFLGHLLDIRKKGMPDMCQQLQSKYGPVYKIWHGSWPTVVISDPEAARRISYQNINRVEGRHFHALRGREQEEWESGLFFARGQLWRTGRKIFEAAVLNQSSLRNYIHLMDVSAVKLVESLKTAALTESRIDIWRELGSMTLAVVGSTAYGVDFHTLDQDPQGALLIEAAQGIFGDFVLQNASAYALAVALLPPETPIIRRLAYWFPDRAQRRSLERRRLLFDVSIKLVRDARLATAAATQNPASEPQRNISAAAPEAVRNVATKPSSAEKKHAPTSPLAASSAPSFLQGLVEGWGTEKEDGKMTDVQVVANANTFSLAGYETTANTLAFAVYLLSVNPEKEAELVRSIIEADLPAPGTRTLTLEDLDKVPYAEAVIKEALRLYPPAPFANRRLSKPTVVAGVMLELGTHVQIDMYSMHRNPNYWAHPTAFLPERFLPGHPELEPHPPSAYSPFGVGPRMCVGYKFATQEAQLALIRLYQSYTFSLTPLRGQHPLPLQTGLTMGPKSGLWVTVRPISATYST